MWQYQNTDELYHHGVLGQRWGFRRYQNADGTLTPAGRRRANKLAEQYAKVTGKKLIVKKKSVQGNEKQKPKTISEMSDQEIQQKINRINLENTYKKLLSQQPQNMKKISRGKAFVNNIKKNVISPALTDAGRTLLGNFIKKKGNDLIYGNSKNKPKANDKPKVNDKIKDIEDQAREYIAKNKLNYAKKEFEFFDKTGERYDWNYNKKKK